MVLGCIGDKGLKVVADSCKELQELCVFPYPNGVRNGAVTEEGLVAVASGCMKVNSLLYFCTQMTNEALITVAGKCPNFIRFRLCILNPTEPDADTLQPLDEGFGAIVQSCKGLRKLSMSGRLTDRVFQYIGSFAENLEMFTVAFAGNSDAGMLFVLNGCKKLSKLEIRDSPFGNGALLMDEARKDDDEVERGGYLDYGDLDQHGDDSQVVNKLFVYRTLVGLRKNVPDFVWTL
ncbi:hypothetical protein MLD38_000100 [Melastoma candidum]|uniref:Uncharacterized protein n=1 Tax=Melastoma candidum TaxID=119954 RepID=A0ACB9S8Y6_9MYRT|nr:hypothetical protein MLD38_000100 [Melastoma candidum]